MAEIINLRRARKAKLRAEKTEAAAVNRAKFGRSAAERDKDDAVRDIAARRLDGHKLE